MLQLIAKLFKALNSEASPMQIALGFALGMIAGFTPLMSLHNLLVLFFVLVLRINVSAFTLALGVFTGFAYAFDPLFIAMGEHLLALPEMRETWTAMYNSDFWRLTHFNNTLTLGSLVISLLSFVPFTLLSRWLIIKYRATVLEWARKTKLAQVIKASKFYKIYDRFSDIGGDA